MNLGFDNHLGFFFIPFAEALAPRIVRIVMKQGGYRRQGFFAIAKHCHIHAHIFIDFGGVYVKMNFAGLLGIG